MYEFSQPVPEGCSSDGINYGINPPMSEKFASSEQVLNVAGVADIRGTSGLEGRE